MKGWSEPSLRQAASGLLSEPDVVRNEAMRRMNERLKQHVQLDSESIYIDPPVDLAAANLPSGDDSAWPLLWESLLTWLTAAWTGTPDDSPAGRLGTIERAQMLAALLRQTLTRCNGAPVHVRLQFMQSSANHLLDALDHDHAHSSEQTARLQVDRSVNTRPDHDSKHGSGRVHTAALARDTPISTAKRKRGTPIAQAVDGYQAVDALIEDIQQPAARRSASPSLQMSLRSGKRLKMQAVAAVPGEKATGTSVLTDTVHSTIESLSASPEAENITLHTRSISPSEHAVRDEDDDQGSIAASAHVQSIEAEPTPMPPRSTHAVARRTRAGTVESVDEEIPRATSITRPTKSVEYLIHDILGWDTATNAMHFLRRAFSPSTRAREATFDGPSTAVNSSISSSDARMQRNYRILQEKVVAEGFASFRRCIAAIAWVESFDAFVEDVKRDEALWKRLQAWLDKHAPGSKGGGKRRVVAAKLYALCQTEGVISESSKEIQRARARFKRTAMGARRLKLVAAQFGEAVFFLTEPQLEGRLLRYGSQAADRNALADEDADATVDEELRKLMREAALQHNDMVRSSKLLSDVLHGRAAIDALPDLGWQWDINTIEAARMQLNQAYESSDGSRLAVGLLQHS